MRLIQHCLPWLALVLASNAEAGQLVLSPSSVEFGNVQVADPPTVRTVQIINHGSATRITGFVSLGCNEYGASAPGLPVVLGDLDTLKAQITYDPVNLGPDVCGFILQDDNGTHDVLGMSGVGVAPNLGVPETFLSFTTQAWSIGVPETLQVTVSNQGNFPIVAPHLSYQLDSGADFTLGTVALPIVPGAYRLLPVIFHPQSPGPKIAHLTITLDNGSPGYTEAIVDLDGDWTSQTAVGDRPTTLAALRVEPCPTRGTVRIAFTAPRAGRVDAEIRDLAGRVVARLDRFASASGPQTLTLRDTEWSPAPGIYLVRLRLDGEVVGRGRVVVLR